MKLFIYDNKHQNMLHETDLGKITAQEECLLLKAIEAFEKAEVLDGRYRAACLGSHWKYKYPDGEREIQFFVPSIMPN